MTNTDSFSEEVYHDYFTWLFARLDDRCYDFDLWAYYKLMRYLYETPFTFSIEHDENRAGDGLTLRKEFTRYYADVRMVREKYIWHAFMNPCSVMEMLIGLAKRMDYATVEIDEPSKVGYWFRIFLVNLKIDQYDDNHFDRVAVSRKVSKFLNRNYSKNGRGGLFPLKHASEDQRNVEIWYQMQAYLNENFPK